MAFSAMYITPLGSNPLFDKQRRWSDKQQLGVSGVVHVGVQKNCFDIHHIALPLVLRGHPTKQSKGGGIST